MEKNNKKKTPKNKEFHSPQNDPLGMYTGNAVDGKKPQQDADDL